MPEGPSNDERNAMRSYLQRAEVRLSTMHRVASAFLGGAGLLVLFPVFVNQAIAAVARALILAINGPDQVITGALLGAAVFISLAVPIYAFFLLLRDLTHFYFVGHSPGFSNKLFNPRFVLSGVAFSPDESAAVKREVYAHEYSSAVLNFVLPFGEKQATYYDTVLAATRDHLLTGNRSTAALVTEGILKQGADPGEFVVQGDQAEPRRGEDIDRFNAALGLAGMRERSLAAEVAKSEASLVRHALGLRRLVLRYLKALIAFVVTTLITFLLVAFVGTNRFGVFATLAWGYLLWSIVTPFAVRLPVRWIYDASNPASDKIVARDAEMVLFERRVIIMCIVAALLAGVVLIRGA